jgi:hypothetical protein
MPINWTTTTVANPTLNITTTSGTYGSNWNQIYVDNNGLMYQEVNSLQYYEEEEPDEPALWDLV